MPTKTKKPRVVKQSYFNDCFKCDLIKTYYPDLSKEAVEKACGAHQARQGPMCMCDYWMLLRGRSKEEAAALCLKCRPADAPVQVYRPPAVFDLAAILASFPPLPRFQFGPDADGIAAGFPRERPHAPNSSQNGPSFPLSAPRKGIPRPPAPEAKDGPILGERKGMPVPLASRIKAVPVRPDAIISLPTVEREGKKPKIVLCGVRFGLSYIFLWMGRAGWSHADLEKWCGKLSIEVPSINTTQSRLRAGRNKDSASYGQIPRLSKKQEELMRAPLGKKTK